MHLGKMTKTTLLRHWRTFALLFRPVSLLNFGLVCGLGFFVLSVAHRIGAETVFSNL